MIRCYITDRNLLGSEDALMEAIEHNLQAGVEWIQIREKDLPGRHLAELVRRALALPNPAETKFLVNHRMDVAMATEAAGVHLPAGSISSGQWRGIAPRGFLIGISCHTLEEVLAAQEEGADYILFGPVFTPVSKMSSLAARGLDELKRAARAVQIPVLALGGVTRDSIGACIGAGAAGVAGVSLFQKLLKSHR